MRAAMRIIEILRKHAQDASLRTDLLKQFYQRTFSECIWAPSFTRANG
jgi:hypothetical protein